ncbi:conjugate transposon protein (plasmid) [Fibrella aestuarina BUZ 2]|uniref:Conjugate transposon protein n=1 Tax=Fibrella aestuarina BUZ 2 TaxID=1166018 RepID=I0KHE6_9BACT|nr:conjugative transposon protein TraN [Fibrella aestuarina]CCH03549.1 conjugate transposon protein [Fibrella aestuarina BUZ 2]
MIRFILLYFIAFTPLTVSAQRSRSTTRPVKLTMPLKPLVGKSFQTVATTQKSNYHALALLTTTLSKSAVSSTAQRSTGPKSAVTALETPVRIANPELVDRVRAKPYLLPIDRSAVKGSYPLGISDRKTTHIIFPAKIKEFDAGTDYVLAQVPETVTNVLRVKANPNAKVFCQSDSGKETNMTVITEDGGFFSFLIRYQEEPEILNINMANNVTADDYTSRSLGINRSAAITFVQSTTANGMPMPESDLQNHCERVNDRKPFVRNIGASSMRITSMVTGIYVADKVLYLQFNLRNDSHIDYEADFMKFYVRDKEKLKRMAAQEIELKPYSRYPSEPKLLRAKTEQTLVYALPLTTLTEDKVIDVELYEKNGGRHLRYQIEADVLLLAKPL